MVEESGMGSFGQRLSLDGRKRGVSAEEAGPADDFSPAITARAAALRPRSFAEMSLGDARKREVAVRKVTRPTSSPKALLGE